MTYSGLSGKPPPPSSLTKLHAIFLDFLLLKVLVVQVSRPSAQWESNLQSRRCSRDYCICQRQGYQSDSRSGVWVCRAEVISFFILWYQALWICYIVHLIVSHHLDAYCDQPQPWQFLVQHTCCSIDHFLSFPFVFLSSLLLPFLLEPSLFHHIFLLLFLFPFPFYYLSFHSMAYVVFLCTVLNMYLSFFPYPSFPSLSYPSLLLPSYILLASPFLSILFHTVYFFVQF